MRTALQELLRRFLLGTTSESLEFPSSQTAELAECLSPSKLQLSYF